MRHNYTPWSHVNTPSVAISILALGYNGVAGLRWEAL